MTERRTNRLTALADTGGGRAPAFVTVSDEQVPTDIHDYCAWLNARERRRGVWAVMEESGRKTVVWREEVASDGWMRERGLIPQIGKAA